MCLVLGSLTGLLALLPFTTPYQQWQSIYHQITQDPEFSEYHHMIKDNKIAILNVLYGSVTIFAPDNNASSYFNGKFTNELVLYHIGYYARTLEMLAMNATLDTVHLENPPLWITKSNGYYVNNAKIIESRSNHVYKCKGDSRKNQVLHVIDTVLDPMTFTTFPNPTAYDFLNRYSTWSVLNFLTRVQFHNKTDLFMKRGGHTFFIPIDSKIDNYRLNRIDNYIIEGHIVPNYVLFTRPTEKNFVFQTAASGEYIFILVSFLELGGEYYVKSHTVLGNSQHKKGEILAKIVKTNIPVANGVVHLISQPLAVFEPELKPFPYLSTFYKISSDPYLNVTYQLGRKRKVNRVLEYPSSMLTYFAPKNSAWGGTTVDYSPEEVQEILGRHLVLSNARFSMARLATLSSKGDGTTLNTLSGPIKFKIVYVNGTYFMDWERKRIEVLRADYECADGIVHVVDGVFGYPQKVQSQQYSKHNIWSILKNLVD